MTGIGTPSSQSRIGIVFLLDDAITPMTRVGSTPRHSGRARRSAGFRFNRVRMQAGIEAAHVGIASTGRRRSGVIATFIHLVGATAPGQARLR